MPQRTSVRVLLVDDHNDTLEVLGELMRLMGCEARACIDSTRCTGIAKEFRPHLILIDLGMPQMDGFTVANGLRELKQPPFLLVALTGYADGPHREKCIAAGFDRFLTKPATVEQLSDVIDEASLRFCQPDGNFNPPKKPRRRSKKS